MVTSTVSESANQTRALAEAVRAASAERRPLRIVGGDTKAFHGRRVAGQPLDLSGHRGVVDYEPSELVITARAGTPIAEIEGLLAQNGQMLAFEPPTLGSSSTLGGVVASGFAGARRPFSGGVRDSVLGVTVLNGDGKALRLGGSVFKNVAGFDGFRLMAGALGCLGVLLDVSIRVTPSPAVELGRAFDLGWPRSKTLLGDLMSRPSPLSGAVHDGARLYLRFSGAEASVASTLAALGGEAMPEGFWSDVRRRELPILSAPRLWRLSVPRTADLPHLPGRWFRDWAGSEIWLETDAPPSTVHAIADAARGHATLYRGAGPEEAVFKPLPDGLLALHRRLKAVFDPAGIFNPGRMYEGL